MATTRISQLPALTEVTDDDNLIINDGNTATSRITFGALKASIPAPALGDISDVDLDTSAPVTGNILKYDGTNWIPALDETATGGNSLSNIADSAQGVNVTGKVATTDGIDIDFGGSINAAGTSIDFQNTTISFTGASIGGLQGEISDGVDFHLNQSTATDGQVLSWNSTGGPLSSGDYEWVTPATGGGSASASSFTWDASLIPDTNAAYDLGSASFKVRHLFLSDNSIKFDSGDLGITDGNLAFDGTPLSKDIEYAVTSSGSSAYVFNGPGLTEAANPAIYLTRGKTYRFTNNMGAHGFEVRVAVDGAAYAPGVTNNGVTSGTLVFEVPQDAPDTLYYQCVSHPAMVGELRIMSDAATRIKNTNVPASNSDTGVSGEIRYGNDFLYVCTAANTWKRVALSTF